MDTCPPRGSLLPVLLFFLSIPVPAHAHGAIKGLEGFTSGLVHPLTIPTHVLVILALGLLAGQQAPQQLRKPLIVFIPILALALALTTTGMIASVYQPILIGVALCAATLVALQKPIPLLALRVLFAAAALAIGLDSGPEIGSAAIVIKTLLGTWIIVVFLVFDIAYYASIAARKKWLKVGIRVLGSWIIAISLLVLAFSLKT